MKKYQLMAPGPTPVPSQALLAMAQPMIHHRTPEYEALFAEVRRGLARIFQTHTDVVPLACSGTGAMEAAVVNTLSAGDTVAVVRAGKFGERWVEIGKAYGLNVIELAAPFGQTVPAERVADALGRTPSIKAVLTQHSESSTGVLHDVRGFAAVTRPTDAILIVDAVSSLAIANLEMDAWGLDVVVAGSQKGLMLPPGLGLLCVGERALEQAAHGGSPRHFWDWAPILRENRIGLFPYTPATLMLFGLREALSMLVDEEGLDAVFARHQRLADGVRAAVRGWGLPFVCESPTAYSNSITAVRLPEGVDGNELTSHAHDRLRLSLGGGLGELRGRIFRIGHLGSLNELEVLAMIGGIELAFANLGLPVELGSGLLACEREFAGVAADAVRRQELAATAA
jgi:aspartate aminotransferase-like enzyme